MFSDDPAKKLRQVFKLRRFSLSPVTAACLATGYWWTPRLYQAERVWAPTGFHQPAFPNTSENPLEIPKGIPCRIFFVLEKAECWKLLRTSQPRFFDWFLVRMTQPCWRKARKPKQKTAKRRAERLLRFEVSLLCDSIFRYTTTYTDICQPLVDYL